LFDAYHIAKNSNSKEFEVSRKYQNKEPWYAVFLSSIIPGLGQLYLNRNWQGLLLLYFTIFFTPQDAVAFRFIIRAISLFDIGNIIFIWQRKSRRTIVLLISGLLILSLLETGANLSIKQFIVEARQIDITFSTNSMLPTVQNWSSKTLTSDGKVPPNQYIVLGDNRNGNYDSREWGLVPRANIVGRATNRFYPFDRVGSLATE
jgi:TM2 domain-containing membrane protein YozV